MSKFKEKTQGMTKQILGQMIGDEVLVREGKEQARSAKRPEADDRSSEQREPSSQARTGGAGTIDR
jgi:uncharacterized protein YjbJ (UPF0337 family)